MKRICTICARGGSKGIPNKNIRVLAGRPLIAHSIQQARESGVCQAIAVSSDSDKILDIAKACGADFLIKRPPEMATDQAGSMPAIQHCVAEVERMTGDFFDVIVHLQPTSPLRLPEDIVGAVKLLEDAKPTNVVTAFFAKGSPYFNTAERDSLGFAHLSKKMPGEIIRRQDVPKCFELNGAIYVWWHKSLFENGAAFMDKTMIYEMPRERSVDIDDEFDFKIAEFLCGNKKR